MALKFHEKRSRLNLSVSHNNSDLRRNGVRTALRAQQHWLEFGIYEGRRGSAAFDANIYLNRYPDLSRAFQGEFRFAKSLEHYLTIGISEGRSGR